MEVRFVSRSSVASLEELLELGKLGRLANSNPAGEFCNRLLDNFAPATHQSRPRKFARFHFGRVKARMALARAE